MRLGMRKVSASGAMLMLGSFALLASGCGTSSTGPTGPTDKAKDQTLHVAASGGGATDVATIDPGNVQDSVSIPWVSIVFDGLVTLDKDLNVEKWGADKIDVSSDGLTYTFHIRPGQAFSDGTAVKASDYAYSINRAENPCYASPVNNYLANLKDADVFSAATCKDGVISGSIQTLIGDSIVADDGAGTLKLTLGAPAGYFLQAMSYPTSYVVEKSVIGTGADLGAKDTWVDSMVAKAGGTGAGGSGMYYLATWDHQGTMVLKQNPHWWGIKAGKKPNFTEVDVKFFADTSTQYSTYQSSTQYDFVDNIPADQIEAAKSQPDYHSAPNLRINGFRPNWQIAPFDNVDARQAFCLAINRTLYNTSVAKGAAIPSFHFVPKGMPGYYEGLKNVDDAPLDGDVAKAKAHWDKYLATLGGKPVPPITYSYNGGSKAAQASAEFYQGAWKDALGVTVNFEKVTFPQLLKEEQTKKVQMYRWGWGADYPDPQDFLTLLYDTKATYNENNVSIPEVDATMEKADGLANIKDRLPLYNKAEQALVDQVGACDVSQSQAFYRTRTYVKGDFVLNAQFEFPNDAWVSGYIATH